MSCSIVVIGSSDSISDVSVSMIVVLSTVISQIHSFTEAVQNLIPEAESRGGVLRMLVRVGLRETDERLIEGTEEAYREFREEQYSGI